MIYINGVPQVGISKLSELTIDVSKDWNAKKIENLGAPDSDDDALARGLVDIYSSDYGLNWADLGVITTNDIRAITYLGNGIVILSTDGRHIWRSTDYGINWMDLGTFSPAGNFYGAAYLGDGIVILGSTDFHVFRSTDYGVTWTDLGVIAADGIVRMAYLGNGIAILGTDANNVWRSTNYGLNWTDLGAIAVGAIYCMFYLGNGIAIFATTGGHIHRSTDYGLNWTDLGAITPGVIGGDGIYLGNGIAIFGDLNGHIWRSSDYGLNWMDLGVISPVPIRNFAYLGNGIAILANDSHHVFRSTDYGVTWADLGVIATNYINGIAYLSNGIVILGDNDNHVYRSTSAFQLSNFNPTKYTVTRELFIPANEGHIKTGISGLRGEFAVAQGAADEDAPKVYFSIKVPDDFVSFTSVKALWAAAGIGDLYWELRASYGTHGESYGAHTDTPGLGLTAIAVTYTMYLQEPTNALTLASLVKGDYLGLSVYREGSDVSDTIDGNTYLFGLLFTYVAEQ